MKPQYLLDTNIVSHLIRNPHGRIAERVAKVGENAICIDLVVSGEIAFGVEKRNSARLRIQAEKIITALIVLPMEFPAAQHYAAIRLALEKAGTPIGPNDLWIAAHARAENLILVSDNFAEFSRVPNLQVENWLAE